MSNTANRILQSSYITGLGASAAIGRNYVLNPSAFKNSSNVSASGSATVARNTTTPLTAVSDFSITLPNNTTDYVEWTLDTLDLALKNQTGQLSFDINISSIGSVVQAQIYRNSTVIASSVITGSPTIQTVTLTGSCGDLTNPTTVRISNFTGNSGTSSFKVANVYFGKLSSATASSQILRKDIITASGTWTKHASILSTTIVKITAIGGGGGGGKGNSTGLGQGGGGGGGGGTAIKWIDGASLGSTESVTIGSGGAGATGSSPGSTGGTTSFGAILTCNGGAGGSNDGAPGAGGTASGGDIGITGWPGCPGTGGVSTVNSGVGGTGGASLFGSGGGGTTTNATGAVGIQGGGGAGGAGGSNNGGAGGAGFILVEWVG